MQELPPPCSLEEMGGYKPLSEDEINGGAPLLNQPLWQLSWMQQHTMAIIDYGNAPRQCKIDPTLFPTP